MNNFERSMLLTALGILICCIIFCYVGIDTFLTMQEESDCNCNPKFYDYIIDLKQDHINVYREDGREFVVPHDSLDEFIIKDNL